MMTDLGTLPGGDFSGADAINERNQVIGTCMIKSAKNRAVLWTLRSDS